MTQYFVPWNDPDYGVPPTAYARFSEPMANVNAGAILGDKWAVVGTTTAGHAEDMDYSGNMQTNEVLPTLPDMVFYASPADAPPTSGDCVDEPTETQRRDCMIAQNMYYVQRVFFDLHDATSATSPEPVETFYTDPGDPNTGITVNAFDQFDGHPNSIANYRLMEVMLDYLGKAPCNAGYIDRGQVALDVVDVLDGLVCRGYLTQASGNAMLHNVMGFAYLFNPPTNPCNVIQSTCP